MEPTAEVRGEAAVAHGGAVGDGRGGVFQPFLEAAAAGGEVAASVFVKGVEGGGGSFHGEELVAEEQRSGGSAGGLGDLPSVGDVGGGGGGVLCGGFVGEMKIAGAVDAGLGGFDALDGEADAVADDKVEGEGGGHDGGEAVVVDG